MTLLPLHGEPNAPNKKRRDILWARLQLDLMTQDRLDPDVVACEMEKTMAQPRVGNEALIKKVCRYFKGCSRYQSTLTITEQGSRAYLQSDTDGGY